MTLVKFRRRDEMNPWESMNRMFRTFVNEEDWPGYTHNWAPAVDVSEKEDSVLVRAEIPGMILS